MRSWFEPSMQRVKMVTYLAPPLVVGALELFRQFLFPDLFETRWLYALYLLMLAAGMCIFAWAISRQVERMQDHLRYQNQELLALHHASMAIAGDLRLETVLQRVVSEAAMLVDARYGAISISRTEPTIEAFVTFGVDPGLLDSLGPHPTGTGLLGVPTITGEPVRIPEIAADPRAAGFPEGHPPMERLIGVPIVSADVVVGTLYLADKANGLQFSASDEGTLVRFASLAAIAIENAVLHEQVQVLAIREERERIAREMHDSLAQVLAYVGAKSQAALTHLAAGNTDRGREQITQLAEAAREAYVDVREGIFALRTAAQTTGQTAIDALASYARRWEEQTGIDVRLTTPEEPGGSALTPLAEIHLLRLVQEALTNVRKHAGASEVTIEVTVSNDCLNVRLSDNGAGFDPAGLSPGAFPRFGLSTMRERAEASGGTFRLRARPGEGTTIEVSLPVVPGPF